jgi:transposase-like protein
MSDTYIKFAKVFFFVSIIQIIGYEIYKKIVEIFVEKIKNDRIKEYSKQGLDVTCPCNLEKKMFVPIELNAVNSFNCIECKKDFTVNITTKTFTKTDMVDLDNADAALVEIYKKLQDKS